MTYSSEVLADSPIAYWRLGESSGTTLTDSSGNGHTGTYSGTFTLGASSLIANDSSNTALSLAGAGLATVNNAAWMDATNQITVEAWFKTTTTSGTQSIVVRDSFGGGGTGSQWRLELNSSQRVHLLIWPASGQVSLQGQTNFAINTTYHVAFTYDGVVARLYVNGVLEDSLGCSGNLTTSQPITIGTLGNGGNKFNGTLDEISFYTTALSSSRIQTHYASSGIAAAASSKVTQEHLETLVLSTPDTRVTQEHLESLVQPVPDHRISQEHLESLVLPVPNVQVSAIIAQVMLGPTGNKVSWWDGTTVRSGTVRGWWDGTTIQGANLKGWWDGTTVQPVIPYA